MAAPYNTAPLPSYSEFAPWENQPRAQGAPSVPAPAPTAPQTTALAQNLGNQVYSQLPGYGTSLGNVGANVQSETAGQVPADVLNQITQQAAERGVATGNVGGGATNAAMLQNLGLTSLNLTNMGQQNLNSQTQNLPGAQIYQNPAFYETTAQGYEANLQNSVFQSAAQSAAAAQQAEQAGLSAGAGTGSPSIAPGTAAAVPGASPVSNPLSINASNLGTVIGGVPYAPGTGPSQTLQDVYQMLNLYNPEGGGGGGGTTSSATGIGGGATGESMQQ